MNPHQHRQRHAALTQRAADLEARAASLRATAAEHLEAAGGIDLRRALHESPAAERARVLEALDCGRSVTAVQVSAMSTVPLDKTREILLKLREEGIAARTFGTMWGLACIAAK